MKTNRRSAFTLVELLVVITILVILAGLTIAVIRGNSTDKMRSAARIGQSAFLGAKDRALHARELRGVRLARDATNPALVNGFVYVQQVAMQSISGISVVVDPTTQTVKVFPPAAVGNVWALQDAQLPDQPLGLWSGPARVRIPSDPLTSGNGGEWLPLHTARDNGATAAPFWVGFDAPSGQYYVKIESQFRFDAPTMQYVLVGPKIGGGATCDILVGLEALPFHQPIPLPSGCVIDLNNSGPSVKAWAARAAGGPLDLAFTPRGTISGYLSALGPLHFLLRDLRDATAGIDPNNTAQNQTARGEMLVLTVFPQTGLVQTFEADVADTRSNTTGAIGADGIVDDLFNFAKQGMTAGR